MSRYDHAFLEDIRKKLDLDLIGAASVSRSRPLKDQATPFLPTAQSVVVVAKAAYKEVVALVGPSREAGAPEPGEVFPVHSTYIHGRLNRAVHELSDLFRQAGHRSIPFYVAPNFLTNQRYLKALFSYNQAAELAGLGTIGRHSLLIAPGFGPRLRLACLVTEAPVQDTHNTHPEYCTNCDACIRECPAQALQVPAPGQVYALNPFACRIYRNAGLVCSVCVKACDEVTG